jgi:Transposase DDE domain group 1
MDRGSCAGGLLLVRAAALTGLGQGLSAGLARWRSRRAVHDPGKIVTDLVVALALGGDCLADVAVLRSQPAASPPVLLTSGNPPPQTKGQPRARGTPPTRCGNRAARHGHIPKTATSRGLKPHSQDHERCRLAPGHNGGDDVAWAKRGV